MISRIIGADARVEPDERDQAILAERAALYLSHTDRPQVGDWVTFADGVQRQISHHWGDSVQTSAGGSWHLGESGCLSFSGSLFGTVPLDTLTPSDAGGMASVWYFHHNYWTAHNAVHARIPVRAWLCSEVAPR